MIRVAAPVLVVVVTASVGFAAALRAERAATEQAPVFRAGADVVSVDVSVRRDRRPVTGLRAADFELLDNGVAQEISDVSYERLPIDVTLLLDVSASVTGAVLDELRRALRQVRSDLAPADRMRLVTFNMAVRRLVDFTDPPGLVDERLSGLRGGGSSAIYDGLAVAMTGATQPGRRSLIVLFSDGQDSSSITDHDTLLEVARRSTPTVAIILGSALLDRPASVLRTSPAVAGTTVGTFSERMAAETGGIVAAMKPGENLTAQFRRLLQEFRSSYVLYFTPSNVERTGAHTLEVRVNRPGAEVRARRGYTWR